MLWSKFCTVVLCTLVSIFPVFSLSLENRVEKPEPHICIIPIYKAESSPVTPPILSPTKKTSHSAVIFDKNKKVKGTTNVYKTKTIRPFGSNHKVSVLVAADEEYRQNHPDWKELTAKIVERADESFKDDHDIDFDVKGFAEWKSDGDDAGDLLRDLKNNWDDLHFDFVLGFTDDDNFEHGGLAYVYSNPPEGSAMSITSDRSFDSAVSVVQHEWSHNFGLNHHSSSSKTKCIMNTRYVYKVDYWCSRHDKEIEENKWWYGSKKVTADVQTDPVERSGDAAEDPSIWIHPTNPALSKIIATDKKQGINIYDLNGKIVNSYEFGRINGIDVRYNFPLSGRLVDIAASTNRSKDTIDIYTILKQGTQLEKIGEIKTDINVYGFSLYHSLRSGKFYALVLSDDEEFEQYELFSSGPNHIGGKKIREFEVDSKSEGIVADDEYGVMYIAEENDALWKYGAEPNSGDKRIEIDDVDDSDYLEDDLEGVTLYYGRDGTGYLIVSSQGNSRYIVYDRKTNDYLGNFRIVKGPHIDGTTKTDGIDVTSFGLGPKFPYGIFIAQDDENTEGNEELNQNFKIVSWDKIAASFEFDLTHNQVSPRHLIPRQDPDF